MKQKTKIILWVSLSLILLDQITKIWVVKNICYRGDDVCQEADGEFRVVERPAPANSDTSIGDIVLDVQGEAITGSIEAMGEEWLLEGTYTPGSSRIVANLVEGQGEASGRLITGKGNRSSRGSVWWRAQIELTFPSGDRAETLEEGRVEIFEVQETRNLSMDAAGIHVIPGVFQIVHSQNTGAAFGMFTEFKYRMQIFYVFTAFAVWVLWGLYKELEDDDRLGSWIVALISAGAVGNLIDRVHKQSVTDFLRVHWGPDSWLTGIMGSPEWPSFNVADMAIVGGVGLFVIQYLFYEDRKGDDLDADSDDASEAAPQPVSSET